MAIPLTKGEILLFALRKAGVASDASLTDVEPQSVSDGISDLEDMMSEMQIRFGDLGYIFSDADEQPSPDDDSGVPRKYKHVIGYQLLLRILSDYGLEPTPRQEAIAASSYDALLLDTLSVPSVNRRGDMPVGQGNKYTTLGNAGYYVEDEGDAKDSGSDIKRAVERFQDC
ncbi:packaged DNA stabilization gp4 family protein [Morganella morganii]|uniref:packaged DNA stabilization gp4 family protein n=1 Tax=Morganella morganii TaxID=582 RepID=UPI000BBD2E43|nr:packaged DNA stabilization gp4 family protein [Morganella morganii]ATF52941.1 packaged DNA stabilization protein p27 [Morganella morganii]